MLMKALNNIAVLVVFMTCVIARAEVTLPDYETFRISAKECLTRGDIDCIAKLATQRMYLPEQKTFGCATADTTRKWYITDIEFASCALNTTKSDLDRSTNYTLYEVLFECFSEKENIKKYVTVHDDENIEIYITMYPYIGWFCDLEFIENEFKITGVTLGD